MRTDPTDNGGLFIGRRPGTGPVRYRALPPAGTRGRKRIDTVVALLLLLVMFAVSVAFWGPIPVAGLWVGSHVQFYADSPGAGVLAAFLFVLGALLLSLMLLKRVDRAWILVRRSAGHDQRDGALGRVFGFTCAVGAAAFSIWLLLFSGAQLAPTGIHL